MVDYAQTETVRLDIWLWRARFVKTRALARHLIEKGKVRISRNGQTKRVKKANTVVRSGDIVTLTRPHGLIVAQMISAGERRGPPSEARALYELLGETEQTAPRTL
ncbi:RNA-binding S4 domain-containing protein [Robiginitomaculum antarcticum]|uniref:RNA-binding S4 domain-containing protein n=1 Tax=Robiginitomaculum antarcticum TaxID=437507 RepID=UPI0003A429F8|nr:RNA-binding S4 domain-containing protein [Robiginitomaculum antarcticum]